MTENSLELFAWKSTVPTSSTQNYLMEYSLIHYAWLPERDRRMPEVFEKTIQRKIYEFIKKNPGLHLTKIVAELNMKITEVEFWLHNMEKHGIIYATHEEGYKRYYLAGTTYKNRDQRTLETRAEIYKIIDTMPGVHLSKIADLLNTSVQLADYHLLQMQRSNEIIAVKKLGEYYRRYYTAHSQMKDNEKKILYLLGSKIPLEIVVLLLKHQSLKHKELSETIGVSPSKLSYHLAKLLQEGIIDEIPHGEKKGFVLTNGVEITRIMKKYRLHLELDIAIDEFVDVWDDLHFNG